MQENVSSFHQGWQVHFYGGWRFPLACLVFLAFSLRATGQGEEDGAPSFTSVREAQPFTPHLVSNIYIPPESLPPSAEWARIYSLYSVDTQDWEAMKGRLIERLAVSLDNILPNYLRIVYVEKLAQGELCRTDLMNCVGLGPYDTTRDGKPQNCSGFGDLSDPITVLPEWAPVWTDADDLEFQVWNTYMCISESNTTILQFPKILNNVYLTGTRDDDNSMVYSSVESNMTLWVVGVIPVSWAKFLNAKFQMDGEIPLPEYQPEVIDQTATHTNDLNISIKVFGVRELAVPGTVPPLQLATYVPVCNVPKLAAKGCYRFDFMLHENPKLTYYKLQYRILWNRHIFAEIASDQPYPNGEFNVMRGPWPTFDMVTDPHKAFIGPWKKFLFPQKEWTEQKYCRYGAACPGVPLAPSPRYYHSAALYTTWSFQAEAWKFLCNENPMCGRECLTNLTCLGGDQYWQGNFYFRSDQFRDDDGEVEPFISIENIDCPRMCCRDRRYCLRKYDVLGYEVPYDSTYMIIFGGKTYSHVKDMNGRLVYHSCESDEVQLAMQANESLRGCMEIITNEMWRYDVARGKWEYVKTDSATSPTTGKQVGYPLARYGHASTVVKVVENNEGFTRLWLYIYGGLGPQCPGGVCNDVWKYEIPWAPQAYYPKYPDGEWVRGNQWNTLKDCPFGGRYGHTMVTTTAQEYIYIFGGQGIGEYYDGLFRYRISTDFWEDLRPYGRISLTRLMYDYMGQPVQFQVPTKEYDYAMDVKCENSFGSQRDRWKHCEACPLCGLATGRKDVPEASLPIERATFGMAYFFEEPTQADDSLIVFGGFRTTWGGDGPAHDGQGNGFDEKYYFKDTWKYDATFNQWVNVETSSSPPARRGTAMIARNSTSDDSTIVIFGGHNQDEAFSDMWILDMTHGNTQGIWTRIDQFFIGLSPVPTAYHSLLYDERTDQIILFGGIHWKQTDLTVTDERRNVDRRKYKEAQEFYEKWQGQGARNPWNEKAFLDYLTARCSDPEQFCCTMQGLSPGEGVVVSGFYIRNATGEPLHLRNVSKVCTLDVEAQAFKPVFYPILVEGVWSFDPNACQADCGYHGKCIMAQCTCDVGWYGADCSSRRCPGSTCYTDPYTREQFCTECSQHGRCINGMCECYTGWGYDDCSAVLCVNNCSSDYRRTRGVCIEDFPVHQCVCLGKWTGPTCERALCLNDCSGRGDCVEGVCQCQEHFYGEDCSLFTFPLDSDDKLSVEDWDWQGAGAPKGTYAYSDVQHDPPEIPGEAYIR